MSSTSFIHSFIRRRLLPRGAGPGAGPEEWAGLELNGAVIGQVCGRDHKWSRRRGLSKVGAGAERGRGQD